MRELAVVLLVMLPELLLLLVDIELLLRVVVVCLAGGMVERVGVIGWVCQWGVCCLLIGWAVAA